MKIWAFDPKNDEIRANYLMMSHHTILKGKKTAKVSPQFIVRLFKTTPNGPQWCKIMLNSGTKEV